MSVAVISAIAVLWIVMAAPTVRAETFYDPYAQHYVNDIPITETSARRAMHALRAYKTALGPDLFAGLQLEAFWQHMLLRRLEYEPDALFKLIARTKARNGAALPKSEHLRRWLISKGRPTISNRYGFASAGEILPILRSLAAAYKFGVLGKLTRMQQYVLKVQKEGGLDSDHDWILLDRFRRILPIQKNVAVAQALARDPETAKLIAEFARY